MLTLFLAFLRLGAVSFGGPAMVTYIRHLAVIRKRWIAADDFQQGVALCQAVPGATAMQCAAYVGLRARRLLGAAAAYIGFGLPAFLLMVSLAAAYQHAIHFQAAVAALSGLRALVVALVANAAWVFARASVRSLRGGVFAAVAALLFLVGQSPFAIVVGAAAAGALFLRNRTTGATGEQPGLPLAQSVLRPAALMLAGAAVFITVLVVVAPRLASLALVMMRVDLFAFGGGFASVPLMFREVVGMRGWLPAEAFMDGIALGQVTPGPIVITATFVGFQMAGLPGAVVATVSIFLPSFALVVLTEPWFCRLRSSAAFVGATEALALSFVGLLAAMTIRFGGAVPWSPALGFLSGSALVALRLKVPVAWVVLGGAGLSALVL